MYSSESRVQKELVSSEQGEAMRYLMIGGSQHLRWEELIGNSPPAAVQFPNMAKLGINANMASPTVRASIERITETYVFRRLVLQGLTTVPCYVEEHVSENDLLRCRALWRTLICDT